MPTIKSLLAFTAVVAASVSCGDVVRQGRSPVYLVIDSLQATKGNKVNLSGTLQSDVITNVRAPAPCTAANPCPTIFDDAGQVTIRSSLKNLTNPAGPTANNDVTITRYHVAYRRADGRNVQGVDVPYGFDGAVTGTIPGGKLAIFGFEIVRHVAKEESPLVELKTSGVVIATIADVTFYGRDQVGNDINVTGSILIEFANFGDT